MNIHPSGSWDELVDRTTHLYDVARQTRLTTEKFMLDGRHTGTGGGNHFVLGGATPADSPFLRRPDLLRSLLAYWHNHPSLSYLFSGLFIGPTSQAPRIDEARNDSLYELELAFKQLPPTGAAGGALARRPAVPQPAHRFHRQHPSRRVLHRQDVLARRQHRPAGPARDARLRDAAARAHEPHAAAAAAFADRAFLARALSNRRASRAGVPSCTIASCCRTSSSRISPTSSPSRTRRAFRSRAEWFAPHFEFRFPKYGDFATFGAEVELRQALEPWHVMGEEGAAGGAVRYVDSSVERLQVKVTGLAPDRYALTCNGRRIPLRPTGTVGEFVAGVRYKAWQPPSALHPLIPAHSPLIFDLVDTWMNRSMGGAQYHVAHPGGRSYDTFPVNAFESESRRLARFVRMGHTPERVTSPRGCAKHRIPVHAGPA